MRAGFYGGLVVDYPNSSKAKKYFLVLMTGGVTELPQALGTNEESDQVPFSKSRQQAHVKNARGKPMKKSRDWIMEKKELREKRGTEARKNTKYTGRRRPTKF